MKKRVYSLLLVVAMLATMLVGCGSDKSGDGENAVQTQGNSANQQGEAAVEADGTFQIDFAYEIPYEFTADEQYITRYVNIYLYDNDRNEVFSRVLPQERDTFSVENQELVYYELWEYDTSNTTLFELRDTLLAGRDILSDYYSIMDAQIEVWKDPDAPHTSERWVEAFDMGEQTFLLEDMTVHLNVERGNYYLNSRGGSGDFMNEPVIPYATLEDGRTEVACAITYRIFGTYSCEGDLTSTQMYKDYVMGVQAEPINTVVLVGEEEVEEEEELAEATQEQRYSHVEVCVFEDVPAVGMAIVEAATFIHADDETQATVEATVVYDGWEFIYRFDGEESFGSYALSSDDGSNAYLYNGDKTALVQIWGTGYLYQETFDSYMQKDLREFASSIASVNVDEYYEEIKTDNQIIVIAAASEMVDGVEYKGYYKMILDMDMGMASNFRYLAAEDHYDEQVAYDTTYSIEFVKPSESLGAQYVD